MNKIVKDFMIVDPISIDRDSKVKELNYLINIQGISHIPVVDNGKLVGIISRSDLISKFFSLLENTSGKTYTEIVLENETVEDLMTEDPVCAFENDGIEYVTELLLQRSFHSVPVVDEDNYLKGIITSYDVLKALYTEELTDDLY